jgi:hypothetical protein
MLVEFSETALSGEIEEGADLSGGEAPDGFPSPALGEEGFGALGDVVAEAVA